MSVSSISDHNLGKARYQELEADVRRYWQREELLGQIRLQNPRGLSLNLSAVFGVMVALMVVGVRLSHIF